MPTRCQVLCYVQAEDADDPDPTCEVFKLSSGGDKKYIYKLFCAKALMEDAKVPWKQGSGWPQQSPLNWF